MRLGDREHGHTADYFATQTPNQGAAKGRRQLSAAVSPPTLLQLSLKCARHSCEQAQRSTALAPIAAGTQQPTPAGQPTRAPTLDQKPWILIRVFFASLLST